MSLLVQLLNAGVNQYQPLYSASVFPDAGKWDSLVKANESQLKEKEMIIERYLLLPALSCS